MIIFWRIFVWRFDTNLKIVTFWDVILGKWFCQECFKLKNLGHTQNSQYTLPLKQAENDSCQPNLFHATPFYLPVWVPYMISVAECQFTFFLRVLFWAAQTWRCERPYFAKGAMRMMVQPRTWSKYLLQLSGQQKNPRMNESCPLKNGGISNHFLGNMLVFRGKKLHGKQPGCTQPYGDPYRGTPTTSSGPFGPFRSLRIPRGSPKSAPLPARKIRK